MFRRYVLINTLTGIPYNKEGWFTSDRRIVRFWTAKGAERKRRNIKFGIGALMAVGKID